MLQVRLEPFYGPMDLLLDLLDKSKIDIYDIEISSITEQFLEAMQEIAVSSDELSDFIRMASILVLMKARTLLSEQEQEDEDDETLSRDELIQRLLEYKKYKAALPRLRAMEENGRLLLGKLPEDLAPYLRTPDEEEITADPVLLHHHMVQVIQRFLETPERTFQVDRILNIEEYSLEKMQQKIREKLSSGQRFTFFDLMEGAPTKPQAIVLFLSLLELTRSNELRLHQGRRCEGLWIEPTFVKQKGEGSTAPWTNGN
ncbi:MAG: segregation/condensation protein A [Ndongobacter sp.]|nr:segregation/condensation protein A [Ndongobacter sp.]